MSSKLIALLLSAAVGCSSSGDPDASDGGGGAGNEGGGPSPVIATCEPNQANFAYDGGPEQSYTIGAWPSLYGWDAGTANHISGRLGAGWYDVVFEAERDAATPNMPEVIRDTQPWPVRTALLAEASEQTLGPLRCVTEGSGSTLARKGDDLLLDLKNVDVIQSCRDNPVDGQINLCFAFNGCDAFDGGSVDGTPWVLQPDEWIGGSIWQVGFEGATMRAAATNASEGGPAYWALIITDPSSPYGGAIYCASGGSIEETPGDFGYKIMHLTDLGVVNCAAGTGTARGCMQGGSSNP